MATGEGSDQLEVKDKGRLRFLDYASHFSFGGLPKKFPIEYFLRLPEISFYGCGFSKLTHLYNFYHGALLYTVFFFTGTPPKSSKYKKVDLD